MGHVKPLITHFFSAALLLMATLSVSAAAGEYQVGSEPGAAPGDRHYLADVLAAMHGVSAVSSAFRSSEMGHEAFDDGLQDEPMARRADYWLALVQTALTFERDDGALARFRTTTSDNPEQGPAADLNDWALAAYTYHMHHRGNRWASHDKQQAINFQPLALVTLPGRYLLQQHYGEGVFYHTPHQEQWDRTSLSQGLSVLHAPVYAWIRWEKDEGKGDMGIVPEERLRAHLGYGPEELLDIARALAATLDDHWDDDHGGYDFGEGTVTSLADLGALLRGHKALYELMHVFGEDHDRDIARTLFDRAAQQIEAVAGLVRSAGLPASVSFQDGEAVPASDRVSMEQQWRYVMELSAGFAFNRERGGSSYFIRDRRPEAGEALGRMVDQLLSGTMAYAFPDGRLVSELSYTGDEVEDLDSSESTQALGIYLTAASNAYRAGEDFERASDWADQDDAVVERSRILYENLLAQMERLEETFLP